MTEQLVCTIAMAAFLQTAVGGSIDVDPTSARWWLTKASEFGILGIVSFFLGKAVVALAKRYDNAMTAERTALSDRLCERLDTLDETMGGVRDVISDNNKMMGQVLEAIKHMGDVLPCQHRYEYESRDPRSGPPARR